MTAETFARVWSRESLEDTLKDNFGAGQDVDMPEDLRFVRGVARLAMKRFKVKNESASDAPIVFILHPQGLDDPPPDRTSSGRIPMLDEGRYEISNRIWFVNHTVNEGIALELGPDDDDVEIFRMLRDDLQLGGFPAAVIETRDGSFNARFYPRGLADSTSCQVADLNQQSISLVDVQSALDDIYQATLCTPDAQGHVVTTWEDADSLLPVGEPELTVQALLRVGLVGRFIGFDIWAEQPDPSGRFDLLIVQSDLFDRSTVTRHVLLELKVLKDKASTGGTVRPSVNRKAIRKGVKQAAVYRDQHSVRSAALCCYDMRATVHGDAAFEEVGAKAAKKSVELWIWHLFASAEAFRNHHYGPIADEEGVEDSE